MVKKLLLLTFLSVGLFWAAPIHCAELVVIKYKIFRESISVPDLRTFADTDTLTPELEADLRNIPTKPEDLREALIYKIPADPVVLSKFLNTLPGEMLLDYISEIIHTPSERASRQALRGALILSALQDHQIQLIEILENYGSPEIHLEGDRLWELIRRVEKVLGSLPRSWF